MINLICLLIGGGLLYFAFKLAYKTGKRNFERTNEAGVQVFNDYGSVVKARFHNHMSRLSVVACIFVGGIFLLMGFLGKF